MDKTTMGAMITALRKERGMTQAQLAEQMNVTDKAVSKWERDLSCPDVSSLPRLAETLGVSVDELMQSKIQPAETDQPRKFDEMVSLVLKAVALAMGIGVATLSALKQIDMESAVGMLGIGLACLALHMLKFQK